MMCIMLNNPCQAENDLNEIKTSVTQIKDALLGTEFNQQQGLIFQVKENERRIGDLEKLYNKVEKRSYYKSGFSAAAGVIVGLVIKKIFEVL